MYKKEKYLGQTANLTSYLNGTPDATAILRGSSSYPDIIGVVQLYQTRAGVIVATEIQGLPYSASPCKSHIFAFHIHEGESCTGNATDPFKNALTHYNPNMCEHPYHAGDLPPLFGNRGYALSIFLTDRFTVNEVVGKTIIVHSNPDDFKTQPAGDSGIKIACGVIGLRPIA